MYDDNDSLFGSPPPSPERGRSPVLALPEDSGWRMENAVVHTQNVGTIALPGSQNNFSKIPAPPAVLNACSNRPPFLKLRPASAESKEHVDQPTSRRSNQTTTSRFHAAERHSHRMDRTLSDLVSLISHFGPVQSIKLPPSLSSNSNPNPNPNAPSQQGTKENPIQVDNFRRAPSPIDAVNNALIALASTVASALKLSNVSQDHPPLSEPAVHHVLQCIKHDPKLIPTLQATHEYLNSVPGYHRDQVSHPVGDTVSTVPSKSKRKRKQIGPRIPAGAEHWDVPFPFAPGHAPAGYPTQWQLERGRRVLGELLGLFERAFVQSRIKDSLFSETTTLEPPAKRPRLSSIGPSFSEKYADIQLNEQVLPSGLDAQRMTEWLSSISVPSSTESIIEQPTSADASSFNAPISHVDFSLDDISNIMDVYSSDVSMPPQLPTMDFTQLFDNLHWHPLDSDYCTALNGPPSARVSVDPVPSADPLSRSLDPNATLAIFSAALPQNFSRVDLDSVEGMFVSDVTLTNTLHSRDAAQSMQTIPTASGSSSVREGTPVEPPSLEAQDFRTQEKCFSSTQLQRRTAILFRAQEYRNQLLQRLERVAVKKWELQIEEGVLQNLQKVMT